MGGIPKGGTAPLTPPDEGYATTAVKVTQAKTIGGRHYAVGEVIALNAANASRLHKLYGWPILGPVKSDESDTSA